MALSDSIFRRMGDLTFPVGRGDVVDNLDVLDPGMGVLRELFTAAIIAEFGDVWAKVATFSHSLVGTIPVEDAIELEPTRELMQQRKPKFPLLAVYRMGEATFDEVTLFHDRMTQKWGIDYIVGPIDIVDDRKLSYVGTGVPAVISAVIRQRGHKAYRNGELQFFPGRGGFASARLVSAEAGQGRFAGDDAGPTYFTVSMVVETTEVSHDDPDQFGDLDSIDHSVGVGGKDEILPDLLQADSSVPLK